MEQKTTLYFDTPLVIALVSIVITGYFALRKSSESRSINESKALKGKSDSDGASAAWNESKGNTKVLHPLKFRALKVKEVVEINYNTKLIKLELPADTALNLPVGRHVAVKADVDGEKVVRPYTPVSLPTQKGSIDLVIKKYSLGKLSSHIHTLKPGDELELRGPTGNLKYKPNQAEMLVLIAAGSGITPVLQLARAVLDDKEDRANLALFFQNRNEEDILLREELETLAKTNPSRLKLVLALSRAPEGWEDLSTNYCRHSAGYATDTMIRTAVGGSKNAQAFLCGPEGFNKTMTEAVNKAGVGFVHVF